jgi:hypothetical protein
VGFVVDKVALGQVFLQVLQFSPVNIIPPWLSITLWMNNRPVGGHSLETWSYPIYMNDMNKCRSATSMSEIISDKVFS